VKLHDILELVDLALVGNFLSKRMGGCTLHEWTRENFESVVILSPSSFSLTRDWMVFIFLTLVRWREYYTVDGKGEIILCISKYIT